MRWILWMWVSACGAAPPMEEASPSAAAVKSAEAEAEPADDALTAPRQVVWRATLAMTVDDVALAEAEARAVVTAVGGFVERSDLAPQGRYARGEVVVRVPAEAFQSTLEALAKLAVEVTQRGVQAEDVTAALVDVDARIRNLEALEQRLQELIGRTGSVAEALEVQRELARVRIEIDEARGRQKLMQRQVAMATITLDLQQVPEAGPVEVARWSPGHHATRAAEALLEGLQGLGTALIWLVIAWLPLLALTFGPPILLARWWWRRRAAQTAIPSRER